MKMSAKQLGDIIGKTAAEVNRILKDKGFVQGDPGEYKLTEEGQQYGEYRDKDNGHGGRAHRSWYFIMWAGEILEKISDNRFPGIIWNCDRCHACLSNQAGFDDHSDEWECTECGYSNDIIASNIRE